jgi:hypothetical protein
MKKFTSLLIGCCLALAGAAMAEQPTEQQTPTEKPGGGKGHRHAAEAQPGANQAKPEGAAGRRRGGKNQQQAAPTDQNAQQPGAQGQGQGQGPKNARGGGRRHGKAQGGAATETTGADQSGATAPVTSTPNGQQQQVEQGAKGRHGRNARQGVNAKTAPNGAPATAAPSVAPNNAQGGQASATGGGAGAGKRRLEPQKVQQIRQQHANFRAQPKPDKVPTVTFNQSYRIQGAERWQGPQYEVFRSYHPERHDEHWYHSHYPRVQLIGGGYYYFNNGYWFPAWGYSPSAEYYAYDGPIYVGHRALPPDQVIADVQAALQDMGYYRGEVDGLAGPLTREALAAYQADNGLTPTAAIDQPTLDTLGMG